MFSIRKLLLIALIGITSVLAAPTPAGQGESSQVSISGHDDEASFQPLAESQKLLRGNWYQVPPPSNVVCLL